MYRLNKRSLSAAVCAALLGPFAGAYAQEAAPAQPDQDKSPTELDKVTVTGSLIPRSQIETASPVITITADQMQKEGFRNVYEALKAMPLATGSVQDAQMTNTFTPAANTVSLLGLDPSFTLVLMNGRPLADYPIPYNSASNFTDLATLPTFLIERVDILPGNQSAIYGSAAIAGVINIILKKDLEGLQASFRSGNYTDGGGASQDFTVSGGHSFGKLGVLFGLEAKRNDPIFGSDRDYLANSRNAPRGLFNQTDLSRDAERDRLATNPFIDPRFENGYYLDPGTNCDGITNLFGGTLRRQTRSPSATGILNGDYCGTTEGVGNTSFMNKRDDYNAYLSLSYPLNENVEFYGSALYNTDKVNYRTGGVTFWSLGVGTPPLIYDLDSQRLMGTLQHIYAPEEVGGLADAQGIQHSYVADVGVRGTFGNSNWDYDAYFHRSFFQSKIARRRALTDQVNAFFLGPQDGTDAYGYGYPAYHLETQGHFWGAVTPEQFLSYTDLIVTRAETYSQQVHANVTNTNLFELPAGSVGFAGLIEAGNQYWDNPVDPRVTAGDFWGSGGTSGHGKRKNQAVGAEINVPIATWLTANGSVRWDRYEAAGNSQGKATYKLGLEFRPVESLLLRANYATGFRAPDMAYIFTGGTKTFTSVQDVYNCRRLYGDDYVSCPGQFENVQVESGSVANPELEYITSKSYGAGFVWSPLEGLSVRADYYRVTIDNQVSNFDLNTIMEKEAECRLGAKRDGTPVNSGSAECAEILGQITRTPETSPIPSQRGLLDRVVTRPINIANETISGITANASYRLRTDGAGDFTFTFDHNRTLRHKFQQFPEDPVKNFLDPTFSNEFRNITSLTLDWDRNDWSATLRGTRYGPSGSFGLDAPAAQGGSFFRIDPWIVYNASIGYRYSDALSLMLSSNNIFNKRPPKDPTYTAYPYYNSNNFNSYGRLVMFEVRVKFGGGE
jgi:outer membrane receptor protein involved in Fe transport